PEPNPCLREGYIHARVGINRCWQAIGHARDLFEALSARLSVVLDDWEFPDDVFLAWSSFMLGPSPESAMPTIIVCGASQAARESLCEAIHASGVLPHHILLDHRPVAPDFSRVDPVQ
ncbi:uncharacterized protein PODANS_0_1520, partial [Podospora anserina S mat+]